MKIYFGPYDKLPDGVVETPSPTRRLWPIDNELPFKIQAHDLKLLDVDVWTSNPYLLDHFEPETIMVYTGGKWTPLVEAPEVTSLLKIFMPGEAAVELYDNGEDAKDMS